MINFEKLSDDIRHQYTEDVVKIVEIYCQYRSLDKEKFTIELSNKESELQDIKKYTNFEELKIELKKIYEFLRLKNIIRKEVDEYFSSYECWDWTDWLDWDIRKVICPGIFGPSLISSEFREYKETNSPERVEKVKKLLEKVIEKKMILWGDFSEFIDLWKVKFNTHSSLTHPTWTSEVNEHETEVMNLFQKYQKKTVKNNTLGNISWNEVSNLWKSSLEGKKIVLRFVECDNKKNEVQFQIDVMKSMRTDMKFFEFLFRKISHNESNLSILNQIFKDI